MEGVYEDIPIDVCGSCGGLWMAPESLDRLDDNINVDASKLDWRVVPSPVALRYKVCPGGYREGGPTLSVIELTDASGLAIHRCYRCRGLFLDEDSLDQIRSVVMSKGGGA